MFEEGFWNGHDVYRDSQDGGICYDGYYCADVSDYEEAEMEYWNTHRQIWSDGVGYYRIQNCK